MLETKRVVAYGKRSSRIVYVSGDAQAADGSPVPKHRTKGENAVSTSPAAARKALSRGRKVNGLSTSPRGSPKSGNVLGLVCKKQLGDSATLTPMRRPLGLKNVVLPAASPPVVYLGQRPAQAPNAKLTAFAPFVDSAVAAVQPPGSRGVGRSKKDRISRSQLRNEISVEEGEADVVRPPRRRAFKRPVVVSDNDSSDDEHVETIFRRSMRGAKANPIVVSDDSSGDYPKSHLAQGDHNDASLRLPRIRPAHMAEQSQIFPKGTTRRIQAEESVSMAKLPSPPKSSRDHGIFLHPRPVVRPTHTYARSPRRSQRKIPRYGQTRVVKQLPSPPELEHSLAALTISADAKPQLVQTLDSPSFNPRSTPRHLEPLLAECSQTTPHCFSTFVETFPFDDLHGVSHSTGLTFRKIGEASYSEVFAIGDVVLKIVPLRDESHSTSQLHDDADLPQESDAKDVLQEMIVTRAMGQICPGFIKLLRTYVVVGKYPSLLLSLWDAFNDIKSSENIRPDVFPSTQAYALLVLPNGGPDLEAYNFPAKNGWRQACSIFWQTAKALATAEEMVSFEHRDLHWGQILVKSVSPVRKLSPRTLNRRIGVNDNGDVSGFVSIPMDHPIHGVTVTIIDLGLARMDATDHHGDGVHWTPLDVLTFEGEGDYQFDVYRMMRCVHGTGSWDQYRPLTNIMWLHYLSLKLLRSKKLRPPGARSASAISVDLGEKQCYDCLVEMEQLLGSCMPQSKAKKSRGIKNVFSKAGDVVYVGRGRGWVE